jgi:hypothetical protein
MRAVVVELQPVLSGQGFRKRRHSFNRTTEPGLVQVVTFLMGRSDPPGTVEIPGLRENLHGLYSVHLGVFVEEVWRLEFGRHGPGVPPRPKAWVNDYDCQLRRVVENAAGDPHNLMWRLDDPDAPRAVRELLGAGALPWLDRFADRASILSALEQAPTRSREISGGGIDRMLLTGMLLTAGDRPRAQHYFDDWVHDCFARAASEPEIRGHLRYLAEFAARTGLHMPSGHRSE